MTPAPHESPRTTPLEIFCSYSHADDAYRQELEQHLSLLSWQNKATLWHDRRITAGTNWAEAIDSHLEIASIILLLVSSDFLASQYCYGIEMQRVLERQKKGVACVIPIILRPCHWQSAPFAKLLVLPTDGKPVTMWRNRDAAWTEVVKDIGRALEEASLSNIGAAAQGAGPAIWNVPFARNPFFTGRDELLDRLEQQFSLEVPDDQTTTRRVALTQPQAIKGLGGIGKTQIAVEYAYRSRDRYTHTFWVNAASEETLLTSFVALAELLPGFPERSETDPQKLVKAIKRWLEQCQQRWLLIFDNADEIALVRDYLPQQGHGSILLTTRADAVGSALATSVEVETMGFVEGTHLLLRRAQRFEAASEEEINVAGNIVVALDHFPLALDQAGAYIEETKCRFVDYLEIYQNHRQALLARRGALATDYPNSVATTWSLAFQKVQQANPAAAELLCLCAYLAPDNIPEELLRNGSAYWPASLQQAATDLLKFNQMLEELLKFSLVKRLAEDHMLSLHRLVQAVQRDTMENEVQRQWAENVIRAVNEVFPQDPQDVAAWPQCRRYLDQVQACNTLIEQYLFPLTEAADLLNRTGLYLDNHAMYAIAEPLYLRALSIREQQLGTEHPSTATSLNNLAGLYQAQGEFAQAEPLYLRALSIREQQLGADHPDTATSLNNLALLYQTQGKFAEAEPLYRRALSIDEQAYGPDHPKVATDLNNLAALYRAQGKYSEAEPLYRRALSICEQQSGTNHPDTATSLNNLAALYQAQGKFSEAELLYRRALSIREQQLGADHPSTAISLSNLAELYRAQGKFAQAEPLYLRALSIHEQQLGTDHPDTARSLNNLAGFYRAQGKYEQAEPLYLRALSIREQQLGANHPDTARSLNNLAALYDDQGKYSEAEPLYLRAISIHEQAYGPDHPEVATDLNNLAALYDDQGKYSEAEPLYLRAISISEQQLGTDHPSTALSLNNLALLYKTQGKYSEAEPLYLRALSISEQQLGTDHPHTATSLNNLAALYQAQGKFSEAELLYRRALSIREQQLGADHPSTAISLNNLAELYRAQGKFAQAEPLYLRALSISEQQLGTDHPHTATSLNNLAGLYFEQGRSAEAEPLFQRALTIREQTLGPEHPDTAITVFWLAYAARQQGHYDEAKPLYERALAILEHTLGPDHPTTQTVRNHYAALLAAMSEK